jgi:hypothetical protein
VCAHSAASAARAVAGGGRGVIEFLCGWSGTTHASAVRTCYTREGFGFRAQGLRLLLVLE